ncbi:MAG: hypothetical protein ACWA42_07640 [Lutibacter sp.]
MKTFLYLLLAIIILLIGYGYHLKANELNNGELFIGMGALLMAFIWMPVFIYHRYKNKNLKDFQFKNFRENLEKFNKENQDKP